MREVSPDVFHESLKDLDTAYQHFLRRYQLKQEGKWNGLCGFPRFKSKKQAIGGARFQGTIRVTADSIHLPHLGRLRLKEQNYLPTRGMISNATIREKAGRWYVSIVVPEKHPEPPPATSEPIGVVLGTNQLATLSDGRSFGVPQALCKKITAVKRATRRYKRTTKGSANHTKAKQRLARMQVRLTHVCHNTLHHMTTHLVAKTKPQSERPRMIIVEEGHVSEKPKHHRLVPHMLDVGMGEFKRQLLYKAKQAGVQVLLAAPQEVSATTCSSCGTRNDHVTPSDRLFVCIACGNVLDRDENTARNIEALSNPTGVP